MTTLNPIYGFCQTDSRKIFLLRDIFCYSRGMARATTIDITDLIKATHAELRALIGYRGMNQYKLRDKSGVSQSTISKTIYQNISTLNLSQFEKIAAALGDSPGEILKRAEKAAEQVRIERERVENDPGLETLLNENMALAKEGYALAAKRGDPHTGGTWG